MRCSTDIRKRVIAFVEGGGSKAEAARRFQVSRGSVYNWTSVADGLSYRKPGPKSSRRVDRKALRRDVEDHPDRTQKERAGHFGVSRHCIWHNLRELGFSRKKTTGYKERSLIKRKAYLRLRERYARRGKTFVYIDESGFTPSANRRYAYALKGQRVYGLVAGKRRPRTSLIAARIGESFEEPFLFQGTCNANVFNAGLERQLCPRLNENHVVVMDNVPFHKGRNTRERIEQRGATLLFLPPYSPDLNPIENDCAAIKINREYHENETLDNIVRMYK